MAGTYKLVVGNLPYDISEDELHTVFGTYGEVIGVEVLPEARQGGRQAYVTYRESKAAEDAITVLHDIYKIRADAERPIRVWWHKEDVSSPGAGGEDWAGAGRQDSMAWDGSASAGGRSAEGQQAKQPPEDSHKLFVGGLPEDISEDELKTVFNTYGEVVHIYIMKVNSMTHLRGAFVFYSKKEAGEDAIKVLNDTYKIRVDAEHPIQVRWGKEGGRSDGKGDGKGPNDDKDMSNKLFIGSLPPDITEDEIKTVFSTYGEVNHVHLMTPHAKTGMRAALVFYARRESGEDAIKVLHEVYKFREDAELPIQVKWGREKEAPWGGKDKGKGGWAGGWGGDSWSGGGWGGGKGGGGSQGWQALGDGGWQDRGRGWDSQSWWQDSQSGGWNDGWRDSSWSGGGKGWGGADGWGGGKGKGKGGDKGYGKGDKGGDKGKGDKGYGKSDKGKGPYDKGGYDKGGYDKGGYDKGGYDKGGYDKGGYGKGGKGDKGKGKSDDKGYGRAGGADENQGKLFVANLPEDIQDNALEYVFGTYGKVQKVHIMANNSRNGAIAAFVEFATLDEAETAIASLNEKYEIREGYGPILVRHANAKRSRPY